MDESGLSECKRNNTLLLSASVVKKRERGEEGRRGREKERERQREGGVSGNGWTVLAGVKRRERGVEREGERVRERERERERG